MVAGCGRSSDLQAEQSVKTACLLARLPLSTREKVPGGRSFLFTAAGQFWILTRFPFQHLRSRTSVNVPAAFLAYTSVCRLANQLSRINFAPEHSTPCLRITE